MKKEQNTQMKSNSLQIAFLLLILLSILWQSNFKVPFTRSGVIMLYGIDFLGLAFYFTGGFIFLRHLWLNRKQSGTSTFNIKSTLNKEKTIELLLVITFIAYCGIVSIFRILLKVPFKQSLLIPRVIIATVWIVLLFMFIKPKFENIIKATSIFSLCLSAITLWLAYAPNEFSYVIAQSHIIRTHMLLIMLPLLYLMYSYNQKYELNKNLKLLYGISFMFHLFVTSFAIIISGTRLNFLLLSLNVILFLVLEFLKNWKRLIPLLLTILLSLIFIVIASYTKPHVRYGLARSPVYTVVKLLPLEGINSNHGMHPEDGKDSENEFIKQLEKEANASKSDSNSSRFQAWKAAIEDIKTKPIFGPGYKQYNVRYSAVDNRSFEMSPHNFILEYVLAFGIIGFIMFLSLLIYPVRNYIVQFFTRMKDIKDENKREYAIAISTLIFSMMNVFAIGLFQPILINPAILAILFYIVGAFYTIDTVKSYRLEYKVVIK